MLAHGFGPPRLKWLELRRKVRCDRRLGLRPIPAASKLHNHPLNAITPRPVLPGAWATCLPAECGGTRQLSVVRRVAVPSNATRIHFRGSLWGCVTRPKPLMRRLSTEPDKLGQFCRT